jgi:heptaprenyl diphosphate synthase
MKSTKKLVILAILISQALILSIVESWIPMPFPVPGVKLGLANIVTMIVIAFFGLGEAVTVVFLRTLLASFFGGGPTIFLFSLSGGLLSAMVMFFLYKKMSKVMSIIGISIAGAVAHNIGQITVAMILMKDASVLAYLPVLLVSSVITGIFVGMASSFLEKALKKSRVFE